MRSLLAMVLGMIGVMPGWMLIFIAENEECRSTLLSGYPLIISVFRC